GGSLWQVAAADARIAAVTSLDQTRPLADISFDAAPAIRLAAGAQASRAWTAARTAGAVLLAAEQLGVADSCLDTPVTDVQPRAPVRPPGRLLPGGQPPPGPAVGPGDPGPRGGPLRRRLPRGRRPGHAGRRPPGPGTLLRGGRPRRPGLRAAARRHRLHLG